MVAEVAMVRSGPVAKAEGRGNMDESAEEGEESKGCISVVALVAAAVVVAAAAAVALGPTRSQFQACRYRNLSLGKMACCTTRDKPLRPALGVSASSRDAWLSWPASANAAGALATATL